MPPKEKIDFSLTPEQYKAQWIEANKAKIEPQKKEGKDAIEELEKKVEAIQAIDETYIAPWERNRWDYAVKKFIGDGTKTEADIITKFKDEFENFEENIKASYSGDKPKFKKVGNDVSVIKQTRKSNR